MPSEPDMASAPPPVVSKRNHFESVSSMVDSYWGRVPKELRTPELRKFLENYTDSLVRWVSHMFTVGAERGIEQTATLLCDPDYYLTLKERRKRDRERHEAYQKQQDIERLERQQCPTAEQVEKMRGDLTDRIAGHEKQIERWKEQLAALPENPKHVRMPKR